MIWFIVNRLSGNGRGGVVWRQVEFVLKERNVRYGVRFTERAGHAKELAAMLSGQAGTTAIVAVGGDGTVHEAANGVAGTRAALGCIPAGSGNDFARGLGIAMEWKPALERVLKAAPYPIDIGWINERAFVISAGIGFDGDVAKLTNEAWYKKWLNRVRLGSLSYVVTVLRLLLTYRPSSVRLRLDGEVREYPKVWLIAVANMPFYGGGMKICPDAKPDDGQLHLCLVDGISRWELLQFFPSVFKGTHVRHPAVHLFSGQKLQIEGDAALTIHADGEYGGETPAVIEVQQGQIQVL